VLPNPGQPEREQPRGERRAEDHQHRERHVERRIEPQQERCVRRRSAARERGEEPANATLPPLRARASSQGEAFVTTTPAPPASSATTGHRSAESRTRRPSLSR
jgi:hypothetical protein